jgi:hypothetical protein
MKKIKIEKYDFKPCCERCGGSLVGDGYTLAKHCEFLEHDPTWEPDSGPHYCNEFNEWETLRECSNCKEYFSFENSETICQACKSLIQR